MCVEVEPKTACCMRVVRPMGAGEFFFIVYGGSGKGGLIFNNVGGWYRVLVMMFDE